MSSSRRYDRRGYDVNDDNINHKRQKAHHHEYCDSNQFYVDDPCDYNNNNNNNNDNNRRRGFERRRDDDYEIYDEKASQPPPPPPPPPLSLPPQHDEQPYKNRLEDLKRYLDETSYYPEDKDRNNEYNKENKNDDDDDDKMVNNSTFGKHTNNTLPAAASSRSQISATNNPNPINEGDDDGYISGNKITIWFEGSSTWPKYRILEKLREELTKDSDIVVCNENGAQGMREGRTNHNGSSRSNSNNNRGRGSNVIQESRSTTATDVILIEENGSGYTPEQKAVQRIPARELAAVRSKYIDPCADFTPHSVCVWDSQSRKAEIQALCKKGPPELEDVSSQKLIIDAYKDSSNWGSNWVLNQNIYVDAYKDGANWIISVKGGGNTKRLTEILRERIRCNEKGWKLCSNSNEQHAPGHRNSCNNNINVKLHHGSKKNGEEKQTKHHQHEQCSPCNSSTPSNAKDVDESSDMEISDDDEEHDNGVNLSAGDNSRTHEGFADKNILKRTGSVTEPRQIQKNRYITGKDQAAAEPQFAAKENLHSANNANRMERPGSIDASFATTITVSATKKISNSKVGMKFTSNQRNGKVTVLSVDADGLFGSTALREGQEILSVNGINVFGMRANQVAEIIKAAESKLIIHAAMPTASCNVSENGDSSKDCNTATQEHFRNSACKATAGSDAFTSRKSDHDRSVVDELKHAEAIEAVPSFVGADNQAPRQPPDENAKDQDGQSSASNDPVLSTKRLDDLLAVLKELAAADSSQAIVQTNNHEVSATEQLLANVGIKTEPATKKGELDHLVKYFIKCKTDRDRLARENKEILEKERTLRMELEEQRSVSESQEKAELASNENESEDKYRKSMKRNEALVNEADNLRGQLHDRRKDLDQSMQRIVALENETLILSQELHDRQKVFDNEKNRRALADNANQAKYKKLVADYNVLAKEKGNMQLDLQAKHETVEVLAQELNKERDEKNALIGKFHHTVQMYEVKLRDANQSLNLHQSHRGGVEKRIAELQGQLREANARAESYLSSMTTVETRLVEIQDELKNANTRAASATAAQSSAEVTLNQVHDSWQEQYTQLEEKKEEAMQLTMELERERELRRDSEERCKKVTASLSVKTSHLAEGRQEK